jgi:hypothetical protein
LGSETNPAHAHLKTASKEYLGKFAITSLPPKHLNEVIDCDKKRKIPSEFKKVIIKWAENNDEDGLPNWIFLKKIWDALHC